MQPDPKQNNGRPTWELVIDDMKARNEIGIKRYGTPLQPHNGRNSLQDLYEELLDAAVYARNAIEESTVDCGQCKNRGVTLDLTGESTCEHCKFSGPQNNYFEAK